MKSINAFMLSGMFLAGAKRLEANKDIINELNVFPVPDGDTGTNMSMTIAQAAEEVRALEHPDMKTLSKAISSGSLRGARGNSGVILSQILRGFTKVIKNEENLTTPILAEALRKATDTAYRAVMKPKEGTMLTVIKGISNRAVDIAESTTDVEVFMSELVKRAEVVLKKTPDMLPVLKQAGVVDSGGRGLLEILKGADDYINGRDTDITENEKDDISDFDFLYSVSLKIATQKSFNNMQKQGLKVYLETIGNEIVFKEEPSGLVIHMCSNEPGRVLTKSAKYGELLQIAIKNKRCENSEEDYPVESELEVIPEDVVDPSEWKEIGIVAVSIGEGLNNIFNGLGVDVIIEGGQTMNPSTEDILDAIKQVPARNVIILPNNKNIILSANQAAELTKDKNVTVVPTTNLPHGITALINYMPDQDAKENRDRMMEEIGNVHVGEITYAVRDTQIDDKKIKAGDYMGIGEEGILAVNKNLKRAFQGLVKKLVTDECALLSIYYGKDVTVDEANEMAKYLQKSFPDLDVELQEGLQPVYFYLVSVE